MNDWLLADLLRHGHNVRVGICQIRGMSLHLINAMKIEGERGKVKLCVRACHGALLRRKRKSASSAEKTPRSTTLFRRLLQLTGNPNFLGFDDLTRARQRNGIAGYRIERQAFVTHKVFMFV